MTAKKTRDYCAIAADYAARVLDGSQARMQVGQAGVPEAAR